jgi:hypothetical protein
VEQPPYHGGQVDDVGGFVFVEQLSGGVQIAQIRIFTTDENPVFVLAFFVLNNYL